MQQEIISYCPQCLLVVFAAMGLYQYVIRDRIIGGDSGVEDDLLNMDIDEMDEPTQLLLLELLTNDHLQERPAQASVERQAQQRSA